MARFNELNINLNDETYFPAGIYDRTIDNPNLAISSPCRPCQDSLNEYASKTGDEILEALHFSAGDIE